MSGAVTAVVSSIAGVLASMGVVGIVKLVKSHKKRGRKLAHYDPEQCAAHGKIIGEIKSDQTYLKEFAVVMLNQQFADMMRRKTGAVNGEQELADEKLIAFMKGKSEFKIG